ncbi:MAG TPA: NAD(P)/FAD-dependent oxidoreductase [Bryobacteraceae bacterium]|nr:NAD(P)/FAD-dependent oxidoreductase [Bryobacteraceae bacterium]
MSTDVIIAGGGPAGLAAAETLANKGCSVLVLEQNHEIGSPIRTSGGSFIEEMEAFGVPKNLYHPISRVRFIAPSTSATFEYSTPRFCILDVRGTFQYLAERAIAAGARLRLSTRVHEPVIENEFAVGVRTAREELRCRLVMDATGYRSTLLRHSSFSSAGIAPGFRRFGVGSEYDLFAPGCDQNEAVLIVGSQVAPSGYAWICPWGGKRVRAGVGVIHPDSRADPEAYLDRLILNAGEYGVNLQGAQPVEHHTGLIPSERFADRFAGNGILGVGDAVGNASSLLGEGIRWAMHAGRMAGEAAARALARSDVSRRALEPFERAWKKKFGMDLRLAHEINERIAHWEDRKWNAGAEILKLLSPDQFAEAMKTNLKGLWLWKFAATHSRQIAEAAGWL